MKPSASVRLAAQAVLAILAVFGFSGCREAGREAAYRFDPDQALAVRYQAVLTGKSDGFRAARGYEAMAKATFLLRAATDSASGRTELIMTADSIDYSASDRDPEESRYMRDRLIRYKAKISLARTGQVLALEEEPDPPPVDFSPLNFGRFLAYGLPAFPREAIHDGSTWISEQPLLDKFHPGSKVIKRYKVKAIRETAEGRLLECAVEVEAWLEDGLASPSAQAAGDSSLPDLSGHGETVFNLDRGLPISSTVELEGRFNSTVREGQGDSGRVVDLPVRLGLKLDLSFGP